MNININYKTIIPLLVLLSISFLLGRYTNSHVIEEIEIEKIIRDTITIEKPKVKIVTEKEYIPKYLPSTIINKTDTIIIKDSVKVYIPIKQYLFEEENKYKIEASGYEVTLDKVELYPTTVYKTETKIIKKNPKFGLGVHVGYGLGLQGFTPYIGVGLQYNIITF